MYQVQLINLITPTTSAKTLNIMKCLIIPWR